MIPTGRDPVARRGARRRGRAIAVCPDAGAIGLALAFVTLLAALLLSLPARADGVAAQAAATPAEVGRQWRFRVYVDDREVGYHEFSLAERDGKRVLTSVADFEYRLMFLTLYRYEHENREIWDGDCLVRIDSRTDANGKAYSVQGERREDAFIVEGSKGRETLTGCVMSFAYWNPDFLEASRLLNTQNGEYLDVAVSEPVPEAFEVNGQPQPSWRYRLQADKVDLQLWYSERQEWLGLETRYENGRTLRYELVSEPQQELPEADDEVAAL